MGAQSTEPTFQDELTLLINKHSLENGSNTPDFILALYLQQCLGVFNHIMEKRETWYGRPVIGGWLIGNSDITEVQHTA
jgi:hypothetical protein